MQLLLLQDLSQTLHFWMICKKKYILTLKYSSLNDYGNNFSQLFSICFYLKVQLVLLTDEWMQIHMLILKVKISPRFPSAMFPFLRLLTLQKSSL